ncbi:hypothetical protein CC80DRAFT_491409 [Byssothecium circinans]|uniref:Uncharacterized protein n=1 Tax=Byssothecium circinans TaxID=147558 RepID=A0A6A5U2P8_9PLEO|nr:hypothetical protein CC80DRAFT_491409 [Byssothecium circinans]
MRPSSIIPALLAFLLPLAALATPVPQLKASDVAGDRVVLDGALCTPVQGRQVCDDGFGNTFFADEPLRS